MPELLAVQKCLDNNAEIKLKKAIKEMIFFIGQKKRKKIKEMMRNLKIPTLIICSINLTAVSALKNKAETQLTKYVDVLMNISAGKPPSQIIFHTLTCFPDASSSELQDISVLIA